MDDKKKAIVSHTQPQGLSEHTHGHDHEHSDITIRPILMAFFVLLAVTALAAAAVWGLFEFAEARAASEDVKPSPMYETNTVPPNPRLQVDERHDLNTFRHREDSLLSNSGAVDPSAGVSRIPIDSAIEIIARRGTGSGQATMDTSVAAQHAATPDSASTHAISAPATSASATAAGK